MAAAESSPLRWLAGILIGAILTALGGLVRGHLEHERRITALEVRQEDTSRALERIERKIDRVLKTEEK